MVHLYIDIGSLLARCVGADIPLSDGNVRDFMVGFTQAQPLFTMVDVGRDPQKLSRKIEGTPDLFIAFPLRQQQTLSVRQGCSKSLPTIFNASI